MMDGHCLSLSLSPKTDVGLLVQFESPRQAVPNQDVTTGLDVQTVTCGCGMDQRYRKLSCVPQLDIFGLLDISQVLSELISYVFQVLDDALVNSCI